jgi:hypothetical protein
MSTAAIIAGTVGAAAIGANAAGNAASTQANAAEQNEQLEAEQGQEGLSLEEQQNQQDQANLEPFLQGGTNAEATLQYLLGLGPRTPGPGGTTTGTGQTLSIPGVSGTVNVPGVTSTTGTASTNLGAYGSLMSQYPGGTFQAPTAQQAAESPGEQFALQQGEGAINASAAANGSLLTGGTMNALDQYGQNLATTDYNNVYNQALNSYQTNYNTWANQQAREYNELAAQAGMGQTTAQDLNTEGLTSTGQMASTLANTTNSIAQQNSNAAAATASGYVGAANAWGGALSSSANSLPQLSLLYQLMQQQNLSQGIGINSAGTTVPYSG